MLKHVLSIVGWVAVFIVCLFLAYSPMTILVAIGLLGFIVEGILLRIIMQPIITNIRKLYGTKTDGKDFVEYFPK